MREDRRNNETSMEEEIVNFDPYADIYDDTRHVSENLLKKMIYHLESRGFINSGGQSRILEIGSGTGRIACTFASAGYFVIGIDLSNNMIQQGIKKRFSENCLNYHPILADGRSIPLQDHSMDFCYTVHVLHLIKDWKLVVNEALRCSKRKLYMNGTISRDYHQLPIWQEYWKYLKQQYNLHPAPRPGIKNEEEVTEYLANHSFQVIKISDSIEVLVSRDTVINILERKSYSSQRNVPETLHQNAVNYLKKHDYFLPSTPSKLKVKEKIELWIYYHSQEEQKWCTGS